MDAIMQAYNETQGGDVFNAVFWFFEGVKSNTVLNEVECFNESFPYWKGGYGGMTHDEVYKIIQVQEEDYGYGEPRYNFYYGDPAMKDLPANEFAIAFSMQTLECLQLGPFYIGTPSHALACFGADYTVDADGKPHITELYISENDPLPGNTRNGLNKFGTNYLDGKMWLTSPTAAGGGNSNLTKVTRTFGIKSIRFAK